MFLLIMTEVPQAAGQRALASHSVGKRIRKQFWQDVLLHISVRLDGGKRMSEKKRRIVGGFFVRGWCGTFYGAFFEQAIEVVWK